MIINSGERNVEIRGERIFVDGKEIPSDQDNSTDKRESDANKDARVALEARYPNVKFGENWCHPPS